MKKLSEVELLSEISRKLDLLITAVACISKPNEELVHVLQSSGFSYPELSKITGTSAAAIQKRLERARKKVKK